jgi:hypothetical protein
MGYSLDWVYGLEEDVIYGKNCKHQVPDDGDAGNGLKQLMKEPLDRSKFVGPILFV